MNQNEMQIKMNELLSDEAFVASLCAVKTAPEVAAIFSEAGINMSVDEAAQIIAYIISDDELDEKALDGVAGGIFTTICIYCFVTGVGIGLLHGVLKNAWK